jgi:hypothetical protein
VPGSGTPGTTAAAPGSALPGSGAAAGSPASSGAAAGTPASSGTAAGSLPGDEDGVADSWPEMPPLTDADVPDPDDADPPPVPDDDRLRYGEDPLDLPDTGPIPVWPTIPGTTGTRPLAATGTGSSSASDVRTGTGTAYVQGRPGAGMLDLTLSWATFAESSSAPGILGRIGPVTATQARALAAAATTAPGTRWRVILTDRHGHAINTATINRRAATRARSAYSPATGTGKAPARTTTQTAQPRASQTPAGGGTGTSGPMLPLAGPHASRLGHHPGRCPGSHQRR